MLYVTELERAEAEERAELITTALDRVVEGMIFANDQDLWNSMFGDDELTTEQIEANTEWLVPGDEGWEELLAEAQKLGL